MNAIPGRGSRDLASILSVCHNRGRAAVLDGDAVAVLVRRRRMLPNGAREVHYDVRRVRTLTEACTASF